ncbi:MAG: acyl-CoA dehydrogenase [bacterium]|nr:acyl-CoA dehydrogenase [bacterium]
MTLMILVALLALAAGLLFVDRAYLAWVLPGALGLIAWMARGGSLWLAIPATLIFIALAVVFGNVDLRKRHVTSKVMPLLAKVFPSMSDTERTALEAGTVWFESELFGGKPDWRRLIDHRPPGLSEREKSFLANEVEEICSLVDGGEVDDLGDMSEEAWQFLKDKGFMGIIIPENYGGLGFSAEANSAVITKVSSHNVTLAVTVMVPNSLGPAELLLHYGTKEQKDEYLPRLANGREVPAFALTEPGAGSDAGSMTSRGVVCRGQWKGEEVLGVRLDWDKRYITLAPVATLLGLAFKLYDPEHLLSEEEDRGITCALVPTDLPGVETGRRHDPLGVKFLNGPTTGKDVFVPIDCIIGGTAMVGQGWRMLMDCLSAGRSISLPGLACGAAQVTTRVTSAYALVREQFGMPIGRFEGIEAPLARIVGRSWLMNSARKVTAGAVASGEKPSVVSAIVKAWLTEGMRDVVNDGMDIMGGAAISRGPRNTMSRMYQAIPIGITVEGANILTRTLIVYGQGALRCHPFAFREMEAARVGDLDEFDSAFFGHVGFICSTAARAHLLAWTRGALARVAVQGPARRHLKRLTRLSASFAIVSEACMATIGGDLKRRELITGRLADALAWMYLGSCAVKRFHDDGGRTEDLPFLDWSIDHALHETQEALYGVLINMPSGLVGGLMRFLTFPLGRRFRPPSDRVARTLARTILENDALRDRFTADIHLPTTEEHPIVGLDLGRRAMLDAGPARRKLRSAVRAGTLPNDAELALLPTALEKGVLDEKEIDLVRDALTRQDELIQVDAFDHEAYLGRCGS